MTRWSGVSLSVVLMCLAFGCKAVQEKPVKTEEELPESIRRADEGPVGEKILDPSPK